MEIYRSKDIQEKLGVSKIQISHWVNMGAIKPYREDFRRGGSHEFNTQNLIEAAICKELSDLHVPVVKMVEGLDLLRGFFSGKDLSKKKREIEELYLMYTSPLKYDYSGFPKLIESMKKAYSPDFKKTFMPLLVLKKDLIDIFEFMRAGVVLSLKRIIDLI